MTVLERHTALQSMAGYFWQVEKALAWLLNESRDAKVGIEVLDDIAVAAEASQVVHALVQSKFTSAGNNLTDRSPELWNTLATWANATVKGEVDPRKTRLYLLTSSLIDVGLIRDISDAVTDADAARVIARINSIRSTDVDVEANIREVKALSADLLVLLVRAVVLLDRNQPLVQTDLADMLDNYFQLDDADKSGRLADTVVGWAVKRVIYEARRHGQVWIGRQQLFNRIYAELDGIRNRRFREAINKVFTETEIEGEKARTFVAQLRLVNCSEVKISEAVQNYLCAKTQETFWAEDGDITDLDLADFDTHLRDHWSPIFDRLSRRCVPCSDEEVLVGQDILDTIMDYREALAGHTTEHYYTTRGRYHILADRILVGWHPRYPKLLVNRR